MGPRVGYSERGRPEGSQYSGQAMLVYGAPGDDLRAAAAVTVTSEA